MGRQPPDGFLENQGFPDVVFGDVEPINSHTLGWLDVYLDFARQFKQITGERIAFLQADLIWFDRWQPQLIEWHTKVRQADIAYGIIIDGSSIDRNDLEWTQHAIDRYRLVMGNPNIKPESVVIGTWYKFPSKFLPESQAGTLASVVLQTSPRTM